MKTAFLFTGQGFQYEGLLHDLPESCITETLIHAVSGTLAEDVLELDSAEALKNNRNVQLCIYLSEVILGMLQLESCTPDYVAGHSIGAFPAAVISGALDFEDGLRLVNARGSAMEASYPTGYGMMSVTGLTFEALRRFIEEFSKNQDRLFIANINSKEQTVLSGPLDILRKFEIRLKNQFPAVTQMLRVKMPSHCELMTHVSGILSEKMKTVRLKQPHIPYIMNTTARRTKQAELIGQDLITGVSKPVYWYDSLNMLYELGVRNFMEISQSGILTEIGRKCYPDAKWRRFV